MAVEVEKWTALKIEVDVISLGHHEHMADGLDVREAHRFDGGLSSWSRISRTNSAVHEYLLSRSTIQIFIKNEYITTRLRSAFPFHTINALFQTSTLLSQI